MKTVIPVSNCIYLCFFLCGVTYFGPVLGRWGWDAAVQADSRRVGSRFPVAAVLMLADMLLF